MGLLSSKCYQIKNEEIMQNTEKSNFDSNPNLRNSNLIFFKTANRTKAIQYN